MISDGTKSAGKINQWLWRHVERHQRRPQWQRTVWKIVWFVLAMALVYLSTSTWDCPIC